MANKLGMDAKLYYLSGTNARVAWSGSGQAGLTVIGNVTSVTLNLEKGEADVTTRGNGGWRATLGTLKDGSVEFEMVWDTTDAAFTAVQAAWAAGSTLAFAVLDGLVTTVGSQGLWADFSVLNFTREEPLEEAIKAKVTIKPAYSSVAAAWITTS